MSRLLEEQKEKKIDIIFNSCTVQNCNKNLLSFNVIITLNNTKKSFTFNKDKDDNNSHNSFTINQSLLKNTYISLIPQKLNISLQIDNNDYLNTKKYQTSLNLREILSNMNITDIFKASIITSLSEIFSFEFKCKVDNVNQNLSPQFHPLIDRYSISYNTKKSKKAFCECFFISSLPYKNSTLINNSISYPSTCNHKLCSYLPSYFANVISRFPLHDTNPSQFLLNELVTSLCFPYGIKICFDQNESEFPQPQNFMIVTTNEQGKKNYIYVYNMYRKIDFIEFKQKYDCDPIKDYLLNTKLLSLIEEKEKNIKNNNQFEKELYNNCEISQFLINSNYVYIPVSYCLVSRFPYMKEMKMCIDSIIKLSDNQNEMINFLKRLIYEIPLPANESKFKFYIPKQVNYIEIKGKNTHRLKIPKGYMKMLFEYFSIDNLIKLFTLMLFEQKILFVSSKDFSVLTEISLCLLNIIYPLKWKYTYIPILSLTLLKFIQSFIPFIMGIEENMLVKAKKYFDKDSNITIVFLKKFKKSYMKSSLSYLHEKGISFDKELPKDIKMTLYNDLNEQRKNIITNMNSNINSIDSKIGKNITNEESDYKQDKQIRNCFMKSLCFIFGNYKKYVSIIDNLAYFNKDLFLTEKNIIDESDNAFYNEFISSETFISFIQHSQSFPDFNKYSLRYIQIQPFDLQKRRKSKKKVNSSLQPLLNIQSNIIRISNVINKSTNASSDISVSNASIGFSNGKTNCYLITPYFILPIRDLTKIEEVLNSQEYNDNINNKNSIYYENSKGCFILNDITIISKISDCGYNKNKNPFSLCLSEENNNVNYINESNDDIRQKIFDKKKTLLEEEMKRILAGDYKEKNEGLSNDIFNEKQIRKYFSEILYQSKFKSHFSHVLNEKGFNELEKYITISLNNINKEYLEGKLITKSLFHYYKVGNRKKKKFLYEVFNKKKHFDLWKDEAFWKEWFIIEKNNLDNCTDDNLFMIICEISSIMNDLNIELNFQFNCLKENIAKEYISDELLLSSLEVTIIKQYNCKIVNQSLI